jgi:general stress protein 26
MGQDSKGSVSQEIIDYIEQTQWAVLTTVSKDGVPVPRTMGAFAQDNGGKTIYFATLPDTDKTRHIKANNRVSFLFQHEGQSLAEFRNVVVLGNASIIDSDEELQRAVTGISSRSPFVKERIDIDGVGTFSFYKVGASEIKFLDFKKGIGPASVETFTI